MPAPKWFTVARNEYRIRTSRIRKVRRYFPYLTVVLLAFYVMIIAPGVAALIMDDFTAFIAKELAIPVMQVVLFTTFFYFMIIPITNTLRDVRTEQLEIFLAAPVKPGDALLGEFLGVMPFYAIVITIIAGGFTALIAPLNLDYLQKAIVISTIIITFLSSLWIGTVIAATLRTRLGRTARGRDIGRALALIIALPLVAVMYALIGGGLSQAFVDPASSGMARTILGFLPSSWGAELLNLFRQHPGEIWAVGLETASLFGGLVVFLLATLWLGVKVADRLYSLEAITFTSPRARPDGPFYKILGFLGGRGSSGTLLSSLFKDYSRRLENLSKILYMLGLLTIINLLLVRPDDPEGASVLTQLVLPLLSAFVAGEATLRGKDALFIYKKTPSGIRKFVRARLLQGWVVVVPIAAATSAFTTLMSPQPSLQPALANLAATILTAASGVVFVLGLFLLNPAFSDKSASYMVNIMIAIHVLPLGTFLVPLVVLQTALHLGLYGVLFLVTVPLSWMLGAVVLLLGKRRLSEIE